MAASVPVRIDSLPVTTRTNLELFSDGISEIDAHCHEPGHRLRWSAVNTKDRVIGMMGLFMDRDWKHSIRPGIDPVENKHAGIDIDCVQTRFPNH